MRPLFSETQRRLRADNPRWWIKASLQAISTFLAFFALVLFSAAIDLTNRHYKFPHGLWNDWMPLFPVLISLIYNPVAFLVPLLRPSRTPLHPGWDVGVYLLTWALGVPSIVFSVGLGWFWWWQPVLVKFNDFIPCGPYSYNRWSEPCAPAIYPAGRLEIAANVFFALLIIFTFTLFVLACISTHKRRRAPQRANIAARNIQLQYHRSPEEHAAHEPLPAYSPRGPSDVENGNAAGAAKYS
ncbi:MAG: hypothetical protein LQ348_003246 [Seirophora lacunosa]|nr:MAG: hypothetical protein LQ344_000122 [Seirophora lacunosa]KAI4192180.1 MAG: hypothetical protein LQ348_003246 [Seirophora lacunosa]